MNANLQYILDTGLRPYYVLLDDANIKFKPVSDLSPDELENVDEIWAHVDGCSNVLVSTNGSVCAEAKANKRGQHVPGYFKRFTETKDGYYKVSVKLDSGKETLCAVHRLVAIAFIPNLHGLPQVIHKDSDKKNNCVENLEWCTAKDHMERFWTADEYAEKRENIRKGISQSNRDYMRTPEFRQKQSESHKGLAFHQSEEYRRNISAAMKDKPKSEAHKQKLSDLAKERYKDPEFKSMMQQSIKEAMNRPDVKTKMSAIVTEKWKDPEYAKKQHAASMNEKFYANSAAANKKRISGSVWMNNGERQLQVKQENIQEYVSKGYQLGAFPKPHPKRKNKSKESLNTVRLFDIPEDKGGTNDENISQ